MDSMYLPIVLNPFVIQLSAIQYAAFGIGITYGSNVTSSAETAKK